MSTGQQATPHVMISYTWQARGAQERMLKLKAELEKVGFNVWMDVDKMSGNMDQCMAEAVENSAAVLVCFSKEYQESEPCRKESQYASSKNKPIIPLQFKQHDPTGWLGINIKPLLYYKVDTEANMMESLPKIIKTIDDAGVRRRQGLSVMTDPAYPPPASFTAAPGGNPYPGNPQNPHGGGYGAPPPAQNPTPGYPPQFQPPAYQQQPQPAPGYQQQPHAPGYQQQPQAPGYPPAGNMYPVQGANSQPNIAPPATGSAPPVGPSAGQGAASSNTDLKVTEKDIGEVAKLIGAEDNVKMFYAHLGMKNRDVRGAQQGANTTDPTAKARNVLLKWIQFNGKAATRDKIRAAMVAMEGWTDLLEDLDEVWNES